MKNVSHSSYEEDDRQFFSEFLDILANKKRNISKCNKTSQQVPINLLVQNIEFNNITLNCLFYVGGYIILKILRNGSSCNKCINAVGSKKQTVFPYTELKRARCFNNESLFFINKKLFTFIIEMEKIFRTYFMVIRSTTLNLHSFFVDKFQNIDYVLPTCHKLKENIISRFVRFRLKKMSMTYIIDQQSSYASKSMAMQNAIK